MTILYTLPRQLLDPDSADGIGVFRPEWFRALLRDRPALVADILCRTTTQKLETGVQLAWELHELASAEDHREVAELASLSVLDRFPKAETEAALLALCWSLNAALASCEWSDLAQVVAERLGGGPPETCERSCWLVAGYLTAPDRYLDAFRSLAADGVGLEWLAKFVSVASFRVEFTRRFAPTHYERFVAAVGAASRKYGLSEDAYGRTGRVIVGLADNPSKEATEALGMLSIAPDAIAWMSEIAHASELQARKRREREYQHCDIGQVVHTLSNGSPANAGDLAALVFEELTDLSKSIRDGSTSDWRQHWNVDGANRALDPKPENACRDALLSDLKERLVRLGVDTQPEGVYAEDTRADIRVSFGGFNVPVEIKRSCHRDLWTAVRDQLIAKYTRDPGAAGFGIYLVFWFGDTERCRPTKYRGLEAEHGRRPEAKA